MLIDTVLAAFDGISIVAWFALLVAVFAVFVGLGIYQGRRGGTAERNAAEDLSPAARRARAQAPQKEFT